MMVTMVMVVMLVVHGSDGSDMSMGNDGFHSFSGPKTRLGVKSHWSRVGIRTEQILLEMLCREKFHLCHWWWLWWRWWRWWCWWWWCWLYWCYGCLGITIGFEIHSTRYFKGIPVDFNRFGKYFTRYFTGFPRDFHRFCKLFQRESYGYPSVLKCSENDFTMYFTGIHWALP